MRTDHAVEETDYECCSQKQNASVKLVKALQMKGNQ